MEKIGEKTKSEKISREQDKTFKQDISAKEYQKIYEKDPQKRRLPKPIKPKKKEEEKKDNTIQLDLDSDLEKKLNDLNINTDLNKIEEEDDKSIENSIPNDSITYSENSIPTYSITNIENNIPNNSITNNENNFQQIEESIPLNNVEELNNNNQLNYPYNYNFNYNYYQLYQAQQNFFEMSNLEYCDINNKIKTMEDISSLNLQLKYEKGKESDRIKIFNYLRGKFLKSSIDKFKNYLIKLIIKFEGERKSNNSKLKIKIIANELKGSYYFLAKSNYGTCVVQELIENIDEEGLQMIYDELINNKNFEKLIFDKNGNHVIQKLIKKLNLDDMELLFNYIFKNIIEYCTTKYCCFVVQSFLEKCNSDIINKIIKEIENSNLINDNYGIHVIQKLLEIYDQNENNFDINFIYKELDSFNIYDKIFSLNNSISSSICQIIQYIIEKGNEKEKEKIIDKLLKDKEKFILMYSNIYGNHVIQKIYKNCNDEIKNEIKNMLNLVSEQNKNIYFNHVHYYITNYEI